MLGKLCVAFLAALLVPWMVTRLSSRRIAGRYQDEFKVVEYGSAYKAVLALGFAFFIVLAGLAWTHPGTTDPSVLPVVVAVFLGFAGLSLAGLVLAQRSLLLWSEEEIEGADMLGRRHRFPWAQLARIEYLQSATALRLWSQDGKRVWVSPLMRGFQEFHSELVRQASLLGLQLPEIPEA